MRRNIINKTVVLSAAVVSALVTGTLAFLPAQDLTETKPPTQTRPIITPIRVSIPCNSPQPVHNLVDNSSQAEEVVDPNVTAVERIHLKYTAEQLEILALIIYQEAGGDLCSDDTRLKVGSVFLNRVKSAIFPDTFREVATQEFQYGRLSETGIKWPARAKLIGESHAVERAFAIADELLNNGSVLPDNVIWQAEFPQGDGIYCYQENIYFCYTEEKE